jgi:hypothetical protein
MKRNDPRNARLVLISVAAFAIMILGAALALMIQVAGAF